MSSPGSRTPKLSDKRTCAFGGACADFCIYARLKSQISVQFTHCCWAKCRVIITPAHTVAQKQADCLYKKRRALQARYVLSCIGSLRRLFCLNQADVHEVFAQKPDLHFIGAQNLAHQ